MSRAFQTFKKTFNNNNNIKFKIFKMTHHKNESAKKFSKNFSDEWRSNLQTFHSSLFVDFSSSVNKYNNFNFK